MQIKKEQIVSENQQEYAYINKNTQIRHIQQFQNHYAFEFNENGLRKSCIDYLLSGQSYLVFKMPHNDELMEHPNNNDHEIKNQNYCLVKNQNENDHNSNISLIPWRWNHYEEHTDKQPKRQLRHYDKDELDHEKPQYGDQSVKRQYLEQEIFHYISQIDPKEPSPKDQTVPSTQCKTIPKQQLSPKSIRRQKVINYLLKKERRCFLKKVTYQCRKVVADNRIRLKGRFINYRQAIVELNLDPNQNYQSSYLKKLIKQSHNDITN